MLSHLILDCLFSLLPVCFLEHVYEKWADKTTNNLHLVCQPASIISKTMVVPSCLAPPHDFVISKGNAGGTSQGTYLSSPREVPPVVSRIFIPKS